MLDPLDLLPIQLNGRWGYIDRSGEVVLPPVHMWTDYFYLDINTRASAREGRRGRITKSYKARCIVNGRNTRWLGINFTGRDASFKGSEIWISNPGLKAVGRWSGERVWGLSRSQDGREAYVLKSPSDVEIARGTYDGLLRMRENRIAFEKEGFCGFLDQTGKVAIPARFLAVRSFSDGFAAAKSQVGRDRTGWGYIDKRGEYVFFDKRGEIEEVRSFSDGLAAIKVGGRWGFIGKNFRPRIKPRYDEVRSFCDGLAAIKRDGAWGFITKSGKEVAWGFEEAYDFDPSEELEPEARYERTQVSLALVKQNGRYGFIGKNGDWAIEPQYTAAQPFYRGLARVSLGEKSFGYINSVGKLIWDPRAALANGIRGWGGGGVHETGEANPFFWRGLSLSEDERSEPYPIEYEVDDILPRRQEIYVGWPKTRYLDDAESKI
ncbi:MAG: WG repeat-containing protein [Planctomycetota bacterium]